MEAAVDRLLRVALERFVQTGKLRVTTAGGSAFVLGDGTGPEVSVRFTTGAAELGILLDPELKLGECYMDGTLVIEQGSLPDLFTIVGSQQHGGVPRWARPLRLVRYATRR